MEVIEYKQDNSGYWKFRVYKRPKIFEIYLHISSLETSTIRLGLTKSHDARPTKWRDISLKASDISLQLNTESEIPSNHLLKINDDFFDVVAQQTNFDYRRRKYETYYLRYLTDRKSNYLDLITENYS